MKTRILATTLIMLTLTAIPQLSSCTRQKGETVNITVDLDFRDIILNEYPALGGTPSFETAIALADSITHINSDADFIDEFLRQYQALVPSGLPDSTGDTKTRLHSVADEITAQASRVLAKRIDVSGLGEVERIEVVKPGEIQITIADVEKRNGIRALCSQRGRLEFWEMYLPEEVQLHMQKMDELAGDSSVFSECLKNSNRSGVSILAARADQMPEVDGTIARYKYECLPTNMFAVWSLNTEGPEDTYQLYALKATGGAPALTGNNIVEASSVYDVYPSVSIKFDDNDATQIQRLTASLAADGHRPLAVVLDGKVLMTPRVIAAIEGGEVSITGNFTEDETLYMAAIMKCGDLGATPYIVSDY